MTISVADRLLPHAGGLSELARLAIAFIDGGTDWVRWAAAEPGSRYAFADESDLVAGVQQGLQVSRFALLPRLQLMVSPVKLMTLGLQDLRVVARAEAGESGPKIAAHVRRIIEAHGLLTQSDLDAGATHLADLGVAGAPVFQVMTFEDRRAIWELLKLPADEEILAPDLEREAAAFGVAQARTPQEFADYYRIYLTLAAKAGAKADTPAKREANAEAALHTLLPMLFGALDCPQVRGLVSPEEVAEAVSMWTMWGRPVGFQRLSAGAREIVQHTKFKLERGEGAQAFVDRYLGASQALLSSARPHRAAMGQDGATCLFHLEGADHEAELQLGPTGVISLAWFRRKPRLATAPARERAAATLETAP